MAGNLLWAHLLCKNAATTSTDSPSQIPPIAPQDKTTTSMRMLIHDTHINLEKFSTRLDGLLRRVDDCRDQIVNANKLLDIERDKVLTEILEIANRCKTEIKTHIGTPAQAAAVDLVQASQASTEKSVQALEKRIDALQALLQTQAHAMQAIQDQQNSLMGVVLPLVPIIHGVLPQMKEFKTSLSELVPTMTKGFESARSMFVSEIAHRGHASVGSSVRAGFSSTSVSTSRNKRLGASVLGCPEIDVATSSPLDTRRRERSLKRIRVEALTDHPSELPRKLSRLAVPATMSFDIPLLRTPGTPRQPLADLLLPPGGNAQGTRLRVGNNLNSTVHEYMRDSENPRPPNGLSSLEHTPPDSEDLTNSRLHDSSLTVDKPTTMLPGATSPSDQDALSKSIKVEEILEANFTGVISVPSSPLSSLPASGSHSPHYGPRLTNVNSNQPHLERSSRPRDIAPDTPRVELVQVLPRRGSSNPNISPHKPMSLRDRRAQISKFGRTQTRRFIPLVPWSDEEE